LAGTVVFRKIVYESIMMMNCDVDATIYQPFAVFGVEMVIVDFNVEKREE
jgi:hypothetical protein